MTNDQDNARDERIKVAKANVESEDLLSVALPSLVGGKYGADFAKVIDSYPREIIANGSGDVYERAIAPRILQEGGAATYESVRADCMKILAGSVADLPVEYIYESAGLSRELKTDYAGKLVKELGEEDAKKVIGLYLQVLADKKIEKDIMPNFIRMSASGLEELLSNPIDAQAQTA